MCLELLTTILLVYDILLVCVLKKLIKMRLKHGKCNKGFGMESVCVIV